MNSWLNRAGAAVCALLLAGCASFEGIYEPVATEPLTKASPAVSTACNALASKDVPAYYLEDLRDCTAPDSVVVFAFSGGGIRSASFGYGVLQGAHAVKMADGRNFDADIDIVSGVSGGSFTASAFASQRDNLFPDGKPDFYRDNFLTHNFFADLASIYFAPWHWQWMFPGYGTNDEMAKIYSHIAFSSDQERLFARNFGELARKGRPLLVVQATDFGNEQPFTFTQNDFDLICSDLNQYPVGNAIAASSAFPVLFSPIQLTNHHFTAAAEKEGNFCNHHRPVWIDRVLKDGEPEDISRLYARAKAAESYLSRRAGEKMRTTGLPFDQSLPQYVHLQDGGVADNIALRGLMNIMMQGVDVGGAGWTEPARKAACDAGLGRIRSILIVAADGMARPNNSVSGLPYLSDLSLILNVATSAAIDANSFETMLATDAGAKRLAEKLSALKCDGEAEVPVRPDRPKVKSFFAWVSFDNLAEGTDFPPESCGKPAGGHCTLGDIARSDTSLNFTGAEVDALIKAGRSAFACNAKVKAFFKDASTRGEADILPCATEKEKPGE